MADADTAESLQDVSARLARIEGSLARLEGLLARAPGDVTALVERATAGVAVAGDMLDEWAMRASARGIDLDQRVQRALHLVERLTEPGVADALEAVLDHADRIQTLVAQLDALPGAIATVMDTVDEYLRAVAGNGLDIDGVVRGGVVALERFARLVQSPAFQEVLDSGILEPDVVHLVGQVGRALGAARDEREGRAGLVALWRATRDPDVQRSIDFGLRFLRHFGRRIEQSGAALPAARKELARV
jgi:DNA-binding FrmR family transcriptional regulator